jgi:predicted anti-sigma-YlaC factor YlaD
MNCVEWEERIALQAGGDLPEAEAAEVERHLARCRECREFSGALKGNLELLREAHSEPIAEAHFAAVRARVMAGISRRPRWRWVWAGLAAAAAVVLLAVALRPVRVPEVPRVAVRIPPAPLGIVPATTAPLRSRLSNLSGPRPSGSGYRHVARVEPGPPVPAPEPLVVKLFTNDPNVVIYLIADQRGDTDR